MTETDPTRSETAAAPNGLYRSALAALDDAGVVGLDEEGAVSAWPRNVEALTGLPREAVLGESVVTALSGLFETTTDVEAVLDTARTAGKFETEGWCGCRDEGTFWAAVTVTPCEESDGFVVVLREETEQKQLADERQLLAEVSRSVAQADSFVDGIETAIVEVCDHTQWAYGEAWEPATDGDHLEYLVGHAADSTLDPFRQESTSLTFPSGTGLPGRVYESGSPEWIPDIAAEPPEVFHRTELAETVGLRAALGVPITTEDGVVAVLTFYLREHREADDSLAETVSTVAADLGGLVERKQTEEKLDRERALLGRIFTTSPVGLVVTDTQGRIVRSNPEAVDLLCTEDGSIDGSTLESLCVEFRRPDGTTVSAEELPIARVIADEQPVHDVELELVCAGSEDRWLRLSAAPIRDDSGAVERVTLVFEDVTEQKEHERSLRSFREAIEQAGHSIYFTDTDGTIEYVNPTFEEVTGYTAEEAVGATPSILSSDEHPPDFFTELWETILDGEVWTGEVTNEHKSGDRYVVNQTIAPITDDAGEIERFVAINDDITEKKRRERTLRQQRNSLERIRQIIESLRPINRELTRASTRQEIDRVICEQLAASDAYLFAWIGDYNQATEEITPREWAGVEPAFVQDLDLSLSAEETTQGPFATAVTDRDITALQSVPTDPAAREWRDQAIEYGFQSVAAVPIAYGDTVLGVMGVYSARPDAFDRYEQGLLRELGERIGHAINAAENKQLLHTDTVVELEFDVGAADSVFASITDALDCQLSLNNVTPTSDLGYLCYLDVDGVDPAVLVAELRDRAGVEGARVVSARGQTGIVEVTLKTGPLTVLFEHGATISSFEAGDGRGTLVCETTPQSDVQSIVSDLQETYTETTFVAKRTLTQETATLTMTKNAVDAELTDRQLEVLALAYHAGYFQSPRDSTGDDLAEALGISAPTFYQHVRKGIQKILALLVDRDRLRTDTTSMTA